MYAYGARVMVFVLGVELVLACSTWTIKNSCVD